MNEYSRKWWFWGMAGALVVPALLLVVEGWIHHHHPVQNYQPYLDALAFSVAGTVGSIAVPVLPVRPWLRLVLFLLYIPLFLCAVDWLAPWVW